MREKIYRMVHVYEGNKISVTYKYFMVFFIALSILPLVTKEKYEFFAITEVICLIVFVIDYFFRWITADYKLNNKKWTVFLKYPLRLIAIIDMLSIIALACSIFGFFESIKLTDVFAVFRIVRIFRYSKSIQTILSILKKSKKPLIAVGSLAVGYILISAIILFNVEPDSFNTFFEAVYWATISLTTVGYGDIYPVTVIGRTVAMISSFFGVAIVALPAGIITAEYLNSLKSESK